MTASTTLYTIGHSNLSMPELLRALKDHHVSYIVDVRSSPRSHRHPYFDGPALASTLARAGIDYIYLGERLGGKPTQIDDAKNKWKQGKADSHIISDLSRTDRWSKGISKLATLVEERAARDESGCLLCSEADANNCHRSLVAFDLREQLSAVDLQHITPRRTGPSEVRFQKTLF